MNFRLTKTKLIVCIVIIVLLTLLLLVTNLCIGGPICLSAVSALFSIDGLISFGWSFLVGLIIYVIWSLFQKKTKIPLKEEQNA